MSYTLTCGPFVGSFLEEIFVFRPFVQWIQKNTIYKNMFVFTHSNRSFMYDSYVIPVYEQYSIDDSKFYYHKHLDINTKLYNIISKSLKRDMLRITGENARNIVSLFDRYSKTRINISYYNKIFNQIPIPNINIDIKDYVLFIPNKITSNKKTKKILTYLQNKHNVIILDDIIFEDCLDIYKHIIKIINDAKFIICPVSEWTFLCNLQQKPVISWGDNINQYKTDNIYGFGNKNYIVEGNDTDIIERMIDYAGKG